MSRAGISLASSWSSAEEAALRAAFWAGAGDDVELAARLPGRTASAVRAKRHRMSLYRTPGRGRMQRRQPALARDVIHITSPKGRPGFDIILEAARRHGFRVEDIRSKRRFKELVKARRDAIVSLAAEPKPQGKFRSLPEIAGLLGIDHTTVSYHLKRSGYGGVDDVRRAVSGAWFGLWPERVAA